MRVCCALRINAQTSEPFNEIYSVVQLIYGQTRAALQTTGAINSAGEQTNAEREGNLL